MQLYQFPISHYCEKIRWALDFKKIDYEIVNLVPGLHLFTTKRLGPKTSVPIIQENGHIIQGSAQILDYLEKNYPAPALHPKNKSDLQSALEWETLADLEIGPHLRRYYYYFILQDRKLAGQILLQSAPWYGPTYFRLFFPLIRFMMSKSMKISTQTAQKSLHRLIHALDKLNLVLRDKDFLVSHKFSRADLSVASMLSPFCLPPAHDFPWPNSDLFPTKIHQLRQQYIKTPVYQWVLRMYKNHRRK